MLSLHTPLATDTQQQHLTALSHHTPSQEPPGTSGQAEEEAELAEGEEDEGGDARISPHRVEALRSLVHTAWVTANGNPADGRWAHLARLLRLGVTSGRKGRWVGARADVGVPGLPIGEGYVNARTEGEWAEWERRVEVAERIRGWKDGVRDGSGLSVEMSVVEERVAASAITSAAGVGAGVRGVSAAQGGLLKNKAPFGFAVVKRGAQSAAVIGKPNLAAPSRRPRSPPPVTQSDDFDVPPSNEQSFTPPSFHVSKLITSTPHAKPPSSKKETNAKPSSKAKPPSKANPTPAPPSRIEKTNASTDAHLPPSAPPTSNPVQPSPSLPNPLTNPPPSNAPLQLARSLPAIPVTPTRRPPTAQQGEGPAASPVRLGYTAAQRVLTSPYFARQVLGYGGGKRKRGEENGGDEEGGGDVDRERKRAREGGGLGEVAPLPLSSPSPALVRLEDEAEGLENPRRTPTRAGVGVRADGDGDGQPATPTRGAGLPTLTELLASAKGRGKGRGRVGVMKAVVGPGKDPLRNMQELEEAPQAQTNQNENDAAEDEGAPAPATNAPQENDQDGEERLIPLEFPISREFEMYYDLGPDLSLSLDLDADDLLASPTKSLSSIADSDSGSEDADPDASAGGVEGNIPPSSLVRIGPASDSMTSSFPPPLFFSSSFEPLATSTQRPAQGAAAVGDVRRKGGRDGDRGIAGTVRSVDRLLGRDLEFGFGFEGEGGFEG